MDDPIGVRMAKEVRGLMTCTEYTVSRAYSVIIVLRVVLKSTLVGNMVLFVRVITVKVLEKVRGIED